MDSVLKSSILIVQKLTLHQNGVEFHQQFNGAIRSSLSASYNDERRTRLKNLIFFFLGRWEVKTFFCFEGGDNSFGGGVFFF